MRGPLTAELSLSLQQRRNELQAIAEKIGEIESDADEHRCVAAAAQADTRLVIATLSEVQEEEPERKCFRLIGGVLAERTVKEVLPALQANFDGVRARSRLFLTHSYRVSLCSSQSSTRPPRRSCRSCRRSLAGSKPHLRCAPAHGCQCSVQHKIAP